MIFSVFWVLFNTLEKLNDLNERVVYLNSLKKVKKIYNLLLYSL